MYYHNEEIYFLHKVISFTNIFTEMKKHVYFVEPSVQQRNFKNLCIGNFTIFVNTALLRFT